MALVCSVGIPADLVSVVSTRGTALMCMVLGKVSVGIPADLVPVVSTRGIALVCMVLAVLVPVVSRRGTLPDGVGRLLAVAGMGRGP
jgi:hypothetical protein